MGGSGWGIHVNPWLIHVNVWQKPLQYCKVISLQLIKTNGQKNKLNNNNNNKNPNCNQATTFLLKVLMKVPNLKKDLFGAQPLGEI